MPSNTAAASTMRNAHSDTTGFQSGSGAGGSDDFAKLGERAGFVPPRPRPARSSDSSSDEEGDGKGGERVQNATAPKWKGKRDDRDRWKRLRQDCPTHLGRRGNGSEERRRQQKRQERLYALLCAIQRHTQRESNRRETLRDMREARGAMQNWRVKIKTDKWAQVQTYTDEIEKTQSELQRVREEQLQETRSNLRNLQDEVEDKARQLITYESALEQPTSVNQAKAGNPQIGRLHMADAVGTAERLVEATTGHLTGSPFFQKRVGDYTLFGYGDATVADFASNSGTKNGTANGLTSRAESRGLVLDMSANTVVSRPLHKFWSDGQLRAVKLGVNKKNMGTLKVQEATEKLDGAMVYAVPVGHTFELWTRNGPTHHGNIATTWAVQQGTSCDNRDFAGLFAECEYKGATPIFEWLGPQVGGKVRHMETRLVLTQIRNKVTGEYWQGDQREDITQRHNVECVQRHAEFEGKTIKEVTTLVQQMQGLEGYVLRMTSGLFVKMKTKWWQKASMKVYQRWPTEYHKRDAQIRQLQKIDKMELRGLRARVKGWPGSKSPARVLEMFPTAEKVEARYEREGGKRGAVVVSFADSDSQQRAIAGGGLQNVQLEPAYSCRTSSDHKHRVKTWYATNQHERLPRKPTSNLVATAAKVIAGAHNKAEAKRFKKDCVAALEDNQRYDSELAEHLAFIMLEARERSWQDADPEGYMTVHIRGGSEMGYRHRQAEERAAGHEAERQAVDSLVAYEVPYE